MSEPARTSSTWREAGRACSGTSVPSCGSRRSPRDRPWICSATSSITISSPLDPVVVGRVGERERQHAEVDEVLRVDAGEPLRDHRVQPEVARRDRGVLAARALAVVRRRRPRRARRRRGSAIARGRDTCRRSAQNANRLIAGMLLRSGSTAAPAGRISSVETLSPTFSSTGPAIVVGQRLEVRERRDVRALDELDVSRPFVGRRHEHRGVDRTSRSAARSAGRACPRSRGSVITPVSADAAAVSGLHRYTWSSRVPDRPGKLRGTVRRLMRSVAGAWPIPMQPMQPAWWMRAPAAMSLRR